jgi:hypothetical protein
MIKSFPAHSLDVLIKPRVRQFALGVLLNDPALKQLLKRGIRIKVISRSGASLDAIATLKDGELQAQVYGMPSGFQYKQSLLLAFMIKPVLTTQVTIKSSVRDRLIFQEASTRFHERRFITSPCTVYRVPQSITSKILSGDLIIQRDSFVEQVAGLTNIWYDRLIYKATNQPAPFFDIKSQTNGEITSLSQGGVGIKRLSTGQPPPSVIYIQTTLRWANSTIQIRCFAGVRDHSVSNGLEILNCCFLDELPKLPHEISSGAASINLFFNDESLIYVNGDVKAHAQEVKLLLPFGTHILKIENSKGEEKQTVLKISPNTPSEIKFNAS